MLNMKKAIGQTGVKLSAALLTAVLLVTGCGGGAGGSGEGNWVSIEDRYTVDPETPAWQLDKKRR
ncbi:hypothetical protein N6H13_02635 [Paenibacillus sp. CC-CFT742]|nr:hypothetical protein [Paenibacillus sp. CC-CFT742]WJH29695.1 hypothetical protein N6H13_02635 [Paenibacillus sp. CC-CFT742]